MRPVSRLFGPVLLAALLTASALAQDRRDEKILSPQQAVMMAAGGETVWGKFGLHVQAAGRADGKLFLNSELDYRDQRNLSIAIAPQAIIDLEKRTSQPPDQFLLGKDIAVSGAARRVKITFLSDGKPSDKYHYQTHVPVYDARQIEIVDQPK
jgi:hypothetical protein